MENPVRVAAYLPTFLKKEMLHIYRQITAFETVACHVFTHKRENPDYYPYHHKRLHLLPKPKLRWWRRLVHRQLRDEPWQIYPWELRHLILELTRVDAGLMHLYFGHIAPQFLPLMKAWPKPVIVSFHGADAGVDMTKPRYRSAMQEVFTHADGFLCRSESLSQDLVELGCPEDKIRLWRTGIPLEEWPFAPRIPPKDGAWRLLQACRFIEKKGLDLTLKAFERVRNEFPKAHLTLLGDGPLRPVLEAEVAARDLQGAVSFPGFVGKDEVRAAMDQSHLFVHPSRTSPDGNREGIPNAALEAMASGLPVFGTLHGGFPEAIDSGKSGYLVPENDSEALTAAILTHMSSPETHRPLMEKARAKIESTFDRSTQVKVLEQCYKDLMQQRGCPR